MTKTMFYQSWSLNWLIYFFKPGILKWAIILIIVFIFSFKSFITPEYYLNSHALNSNNRICLTRFRCIVSELNAHRYRYYTDESLKICPFCTNIIEDEIHAIFFCPAYSNARKKFLDTKFLSKPNLHTLTILISNCHYQNQLSKYLKAMFSQRKQILNKQLS